MTRIVKRWTEDEGGSLVKKGSLGHVLGCVQLSFMQELIRLLMTIADF